MLYPTLGNTKYKHERLPIRDINPAVEQHVYQYIIPQSNNMFTNRKPCEGYYNKDTYIYGIQIMTVSVLLLSFNARDTGMNSSVTQQSTPLAENSTLGAVVYAPTHRYIFWQVAHVAVAAAAVDVFRTRRRNVKGVLLEVQGDRTSPICSKRGDRKVTKPFHFFLICRDLEPL